MCFRNETVYDQKKLVARPLVVDEYHCKIGCAQLEMVNGLLIFDLYLTFITEKHIFSASPTSMLMANVFYWERKRRSINYVR